MMRASLVEHRQAGSDYDAAETFTLIYDHHASHIQQTLTELQHDFTGMIVSTLYVHLGHHNCLEIIVLKNKASAIKKLADRLIGTKGSSTAS